MRNGKNPTAKQKKYLQKRRLNPDNRLAVKETAAGLEIRHKETKTVKIM